MQENAPIRRKDYLGQFGGIHSDDWLEGRALRREAEEYFEVVIAGQRQALERNPEDTNAWWRLASVLRRKGDWTEVAAAYRRIAELKPDDTGYWYLAAWAHFSAGDAEKYRRVCADMLKRFGQTTDPNTAGRLLYAFLPVADSLADPRPLLPLGEMAGALKGNARVLGGALYRAGKYEAAIPRLEEGQGRAWDHLFLAMAHHRLGHAERAREYLEKASQQIRSDDYPWPETVENEHLLHEAEALIRGPVGVPASAGGSP
jgi:tetratricopeptide (TPR) repeat protein